MNFEALVKHISTIQDTLQAQAAHAVNLALTARNWLMGCYIVEFEQNGEDRAAYGEQLLKKLEQRLNVKGLNERRFREFRRLYLVYPQLKEPIAQYIVSRSQIRHTLSAEFIEPIRRLSSAESATNIRRMPSAELDDAKRWMIPADKLFNRLTYSNLMLISTIDNPVKRAFYEMETIRGCWSYKELERQINSLYYERSGLSRNKEALSALVQQQAAPLQPKDVINTPVTLEFLGLNERVLVTESDLEQSILDNLQRFLLEMGHGFCFEARQKRILIDGDYFFADLVFYHRILKCHVIVELKIATEPVPQLLQGGSDAARRQSAHRHPALHREGRYDGEVRHRRIRPEHLCTEVHDRTSKRGRNQAVYFGRNLLGCPALP